MTAKPGNASRAFLWNGVALKRIGVISDTHNMLPTEAFELFDGEWSEDQLRRAIRLAMKCSYDDGGNVHLEDVIADARKDAKTDKVDFILHAGDICKQSILDELEAIAPTVAVLGNNDYEPLYCSDGSVQAFRSLNYEGVEIVMAHIPQDLNRALVGRPPLVQKLVKREPDLAIYGHTHVPDITINGNHVIMNPGSASRGRSGSGHNVALVDIEDGRLARIYSVSLS